MTAHLVISKHSQLGALGADDHVQYLLIDGSRAMTGNLVLDGDGSGVGLWLGAGQDANMFYSGSELVINTALVAPSDFTIACGTNKTVVLTETVWNDLRVALTPGKIGASNPPSFSKFKDNGAGSVGVNTPSFAYQAVVGNEEQMWFPAQLPHKYKLGTDIEVHIHWTPAVTGGVDEYVKWGLEYTWQNIDGTFGNTTIIASNASTGATATLSGDTTLTADKHYVTIIGIIAGTDKDISSMLICRVFRNSSDATDDLTEDAFAFELDFHFEVDTMGSRQTFVK